MCVGGVTSLVGVVYTLFLTDRGGVLGVLLTRPAVVTAPLAFLTMVLVSRRTRSRIPLDANRTLLRLHAPERLGLDHDRAEQQPSSGPQ
jgi:hypothetical protein